MQGQHFFSRYVEQILSECGLQYLTVDQKSRYIPNIVAFLEERVGLELLPKLDKSEIAAFETMSHDQKTSSQQWKAFWTKAVPNFEEEMARILAAFAQRTKERLCS